MIATSYADDLHVAELAGLDRHLVFDMLHDADLPPGWFANAVARELAARTHHQQGEPACL